MENKHNFLHLQKSLFGGLEEFDSSVEENFSLKANAKRLVIRQKSTVSPLNTSQQANKNSQLSESPHTVASSTAMTALPAALKTMTEDQDNTRRVSWLRSNVEKIPPQNRNTDAPLNSTIQELLPTNKSRAKSDDASPKLFAPSVFGGKTVQFSANDSILSTRSYLDETSADVSIINTDPHPARITLIRPGYYTIPSLDKLIDYIGEDGSCIVPNFTIGRKGYGNVYFGEPIDVAGLNLDELVHFRNKEVIIYPDDENKPPVGTELNRKAQITLDQVWPHDKTLHEPIKDRERLDEMNYEAKLRAVCDKHDTRFVEYRPETGSWVFKVDHFSKYGLNDSDEDDEIVDTRKVKTSATEIRPNPRTGTIPKVNQMPQYSFMICMTKVRIDSFVFSRAKLGLTYIGRRR